MASHDIDVHIQPAVVGNCDTSPEPLAKEGEGLPSNRRAKLSKGRTVATLSIGALVLSFQAIVYFVLSGTRCRRFHCNRFQRWLWLSPLWLSGPLSGVAFVALCVHRSHRGSSASVFRRWTFRFAVLNLLASVLSPSALLLRECSDGSALVEEDTVVLIGYIFEAAWVLSYGSSQAILLSLVHQRVDSLAQRATSRVLLVVFIFMLSMLLLSFVPIGFWSAYIHSPYRISVGACYMIAFAIGTVVATGAIRNAAIAGEKVASLVPVDKRVAFVKAVFWTRWTAYATLFSMGSSMLAQVSLFVWMFYDYPASPLRYAADWLGAVDFVMNVWCAASLAGLIGSKIDVNISETALDEVGQALVATDSGESQDSK